MEKKEGSAKQHERRNHSISLERFGQQRGQVRALEEFRNRKNKKRLETAKALRTYKKTMKMEGFEAGKGAARKRKVPDVETADHVRESENSQPSKRHKSNTMQKSIEKARKKKEESEEMKKSMEESRNERDRKLKERKKMSRLLAKRTKRGQPIMKHTIENMLRKLEQG